MTRNTCWKCSTSVSFSVWALVTQSHMVLNFFLAQKENTPPIWGINTSPHKKSNEAILEKPTCGTKRVVLDISTFHILDSRKYPGLLDMLVTKRDLSIEFIQEIGQHVRQSVVVAFDMEFGGLAQRVDYLDSIEVRYSKLRSAVQT